MEWSSGKRMHIRRGKGVGGSDRKERAVRRNLS